MPPPRGLPQAPRETDQLELVGRILRIGVAPLRALQLVRVRTPPVPSCTSLPDAPPQDRLRGGSVRTGFTASFSCGPWPPEHDEHLDGPPAGVISPLANDMRLDVVTAWWLLWSPRRRRARPATGCRGSCRAVACPLVADPVDGAAAQQVDRGVNRSRDQPISQRKRRRGGDASARPSSAWLTAPCPTVSGDPCVADHLLAILGDPPVEHGVAELDQRVAEDHGRMRSPSLSVWAWCLRCTATIDEPGPR